MSHRFGKQALAIGVALVVGVIACKGQVVLGDDAQKGTGALGEGPNASGTCNAGLVVCGGICVQLGANDENCGACGTTCGAGTTCSATGCIGGDGETGSTVQPSVDGGFPDATTATSETGGSTTGMVDSGCPSTPTVMPGGACTSTWECIGGHPCIDNICDPGSAFDAGPGCYGPRGVGESCSSVVTCAAPLSCVDSICTAPTGVDGGVPEASTTTGEPALGDMGGLVVGSGGACITQAAASTAAFVGRVMSPTDTVVSYIDVFDATLVGEWVGTGSNPWVEPYQAAISFASNGVYGATSARAYTTGYVPDAPLEDGVTPSDAFDGPPAEIFYYGGNEWCTNTNLWTVSTVSTDGTVSGTISYPAEGMTAGSIDCTAAPVVGQARTVQLDVSGNRLRISWYNQFGYGPVNLDLYRACPTP